MRDRVIAIACADLHLTLQPPVARSKEANWLEAMGRTVGQLRELQEKYDCPVICAGDIFDRWNAPAELINWALANLPHMVSIPGQHDLPLHNLADIHRSAYWTLVEAGKILHIDSGVTHAHPPSFCITGFPWGEPAKPCIHRSKLLNIALIHTYCWTAGAGFPNAPSEAYCPHFRKALKGYDVAIFGDNHKGFLTTCGDTTVFNCGSLLRRKSDEIKYRPMVGLIQQSGAILLHYLNTEHDVIETTIEPKAVEPSEGLDSFLQKLSKLRQTKLDFREAVLEMLETEKPSQAVRQALLEAMEHGDTE